MLVTVDLAHNKLKSLPGSFGFLSKVTSLNPASNCIESIPPEISSMTCLSSLDLTNNHLKEVPESLQDLGHLGNITCSICVDGESAFLLQKSCI